MTNEYGPNTLSDAILKTFAFFDVFDYPLTSFEVYKWLFWPDRAYSFAEVLDELERNSLIDFADGFYFLSGRTQIIKTRAERYQLSKKKYRVGLRAAAILRYLAYVEMVAVCNNTGYSNSRKESDIDLFIVVRQGRIWWTRMMVTLLANVLGIRRHGTRISDRVCLSFYLSSARLNLNDIANQPIDPYFIYWLATLVPLYGMLNYLRFMEANDWVKAFLPNLVTMMPVDKRSVPESRIEKYYRTLDEGVLNTKLGDVLNRVARFMQQKKMEHNIHSAAKQENTNVIINDEMLKFHENDRRAVYYTLWRERLESLTKSSHA